MFSFYVINLRAEVGDPQRFVGKGIAKKCLFNQWKRGTVIRIVNMEGINTMFQVQWENGSQQNTRLIEDYLNSEVWLEEEQRDVVHNIKSILLAKLATKRDKNREQSETPKVEKIRSEDTKYTPWKKCTHNNKTNNKG